jgi:hypothetical protein
MKRFFYARTARVLRPLGAIPADRARDPGDCSGPPMSATPADRAQQLRLKQPDPA